VFLDGIAGVKRSTATSTAMAAKSVVKSAKNGVVAIASPECAAIYGLEILQEHIQNRNANYTRFICISRKPEIYPGADKISIMGTLPHRPGALYSLLARFAVLGVNLTKLESRPKRGEDFEYMFYFDFEASLANPELRSLLCELVADGGKFTFLGNYTEK
jgi:chorismate mutase/prephenate dehydratase